MNPSKCNLSYEEREPIAVLIKFGAGFDDIKNEFEKRFNKCLRLEVTRIFIPNCFLLVRLQRWFSVNLKSFISFGQLRRLLTTSITLKLKAQIFT